MGPIRVSFCHFAAFAFCSILETKRQQSPANVLFYSQWGTNPDVNLSFCSHCIGGHIGDQKKKNQLLICIILQPVGGPLEMSICHFAAMEMHINNQLFYSQWGTDGEETSWRSDEILQQAGETGQLAFPSIVITYVQKS